jgi:hypothetical protein
VAVKDTGHFLAQSDLPEIEGSAPMGDVFERLNKLNRGSVIMLDEGRPRHYVKVTELAEAVVERANEAGSDKLEAVSGTALNSFLDRGFAKKFFVPISDQPLDAATDETDLKVGPDRVFIVSEKGQPTGYFGNHETVFETVVRTPIFYCVNGHPNTSVGDGTCSQCPEGIVTMRSQ